MAGFLNELDVEVLGNNQFKLKKTLSYKTDLFDHKHNIIKIPKGFITNFASSLLIKFGEKSATLHDYLYSIKIGRALADKIFLEALKSENVSFASRWACYIGVRLFGWGYYY